MNWPSGQSCEIVEQIQYQRVGLEWRERASWLEPGEVCRVLMLGGFRWLRGLVPEVQRDVGDRVRLVLGRSCLPQELGLVVQVGASDEIAQVALRRSVL